MDCFISCRKPTSVISVERKASLAFCNEASSEPNGEEFDTEMKLITLMSLYPYVDQGTLLDILIASDGSVEKVTKTLGGSRSAPSSKRSLNGVGQQTSLLAFKRARDESDDVTNVPSTKSLTRKGQTLHLYSPEDIETHTPCSIIHNFLPAQMAEDLLKEMLEEAPTFERQTFKMFDNVVQSPHSACFYVESLQEKKSQTTEYLYNGSYLTV